MANYCMPILAKEVREILVQQIFTLGMRSVGGARFQNLLSLEVLYFQFLNMTDSRLQGLAEAIVTHSRLQLLNLHKSYIDPHGMRIVA